MRDEHCLKCLEARAKQFRQRTDLSVEEIIKSNQEAVARLVRLTEKANE